MTRPEIKTCTVCKAEYTDYVEHSMRMRHIIAIRFQAQQRKPRRLV